MSEPAEFTDEQRTAVISVWQKIQGDPALIDGLLYGELDDFLGGVITYASTCFLWREVPVSLVKRMMGEPNLLEIIELGKEIVSLPVFRKALNELAGMES